MNYFEKKLKSSSPIELPIDPIELYSTCSHNEDYEYLRGIQEEVLKTWHERRDEKDVICKMNTGSGKTLTGLLMLYSKMVEKSMPSLYICPDSQLVNQTLRMGELYGIPVCGFDPEDQSTIPNDFKNSKKILVCNFSKFFNGKSVFKRDKIKIGALVIDDAHKCVDIAREKSSLRIHRNHEIGETLFDLFTPSLKYQLVGTFYRLEDGDPTIVMKVPYWEWIDKHDEVAKTISSYITKSGNDCEGEIMFPWNFVSNNLLRYDCYFGGSRVEISPVHVPYHELPSLHEADHRYVLSATFEDDYDLIRDLGISKESLLNPIVPKDRKDVGKRLILAPNRFDPSLDEDALREFIADYPDKGYNVVVLTPSKEKAAPWEDVGATLQVKDEVVESIEKLKEEQGHFVVFPNRYDGIDLLGDMCRILVIDGLPGYSSLLEQYAETRIETFSTGKKAQIIEQGLGRAVRSGGDYSVIFILGSSLVSFLGYEKNLQSFTPVTRAQLKLGLELLDEDAKKEDSLKMIEEVTQLCLVNDSNWSKFHAGALTKLSPETLEPEKIRQLDIAEYERLALSQFDKRNYEVAAEIVLNDLLTYLENDKEKAWYTQFAAQLMYKGNKTRANDLQAKAVDLSGHMFHPSQGYSFKKLSTPNPQAQKVKELLEQFDRPQDIMNYIHNTLLENFQYTKAIEAHEFEKSLYNIGEFLGFTVQMPEQDMGASGPDVLWMMTDSVFLILEAKSRTSHAEISQDDVEQLLHSEQWFIKQYSKHQNSLCVTLQPPAKKGKLVNVHDRFRVIDKDSLELLRNNIFDFGRALQSKHPKEYSVAEISAMLTTHKLTPTAFRDTYLKKIK
jgi:replicative superfamily II helicase